MQVVDHEAWSERNVHAVHVLGSVALPQSASHVGDLLRLKDFAGQTPRIEIVIFLSFQTKANSNYVDAQDHFFQIIITENTRHLENTINELRNKCETNKKCLLSSKATVLRWNTSLGMLNRSLAEAE